MRSIPARALQRRAGGRRITCAAPTRSPCSRTRTPTARSTRRTSSPASTSPSVVTGRGGIWVMNPPYLLFYRDRDGDGVPDGDPEVRLAGFGLEDTHSLANSLTWGPDGWLYGVHGAPARRASGGSRSSGRRSGATTPRRTGSSCSRKAAGTVDALVRQQGPGLLRRQRRQQPRISWVEADDTRRTGRSTGRSPDRSRSASFRTWTTKEYSARFAMTGVIYEDGKLPGCEGQLISGMALTSRMQATRLVADGSTFRTVDTDALLTTADRSFSGRYGRWARRRCHRRLVRHPDGSPIRATPGTSLRPDLAAACQRLPAGASASPGRAEQPGTRAAARRRRKWYTNTRDDCSANVRTVRSFPSCGSSCATTRRRRTRGLVDGEPDRADRSRLGLRAAGASGRRRARGPCGCSGPPRRSFPSMRDTLVRLARTEPDAEGGASSRTRRRVSPADALAVLGALVSREEDVSDRHIPRIWWALEQHWAVNRTSS